jgi:hypothetical protein
MQLITFNYLREGEIKNTISVYTKEDVGFEEYTYNGYYSKLRKDLESWCFIKSQKSKFDSIYLWEFVKKWTWAIGPRIYQTKDGEYEIVGERFHEKDHIQFAMAMFNFYSMYAETI